MYIDIYTHSHIHNVYASIQKMKHLYNVTNYYHREFTFGDTNLSRLVEMLRPVYITRGLFEIRPCLKLKM